MKGREEHPEINAYGNNPVLKFIYDPFKGRLNPYLSTILFLFCIPMAILIGVAAVEGTLIIKGDGLGFLEDVPLILIILIIALIATTGYRLFEKYSQFYKKMEPVVDRTRITEGQFSDYVNRADQLIKGKGVNRNRKLLFYLIWVPTSLYTVILFEHLYGFMDRDVWRYPDHTLSYITFEIYLVFITILILGPLMYRFVSIIAVLNRFPKFLYRNHALKLVPLSPDKAGGLRPIGELGLTFNLIIVLPMFYIAINVLWWGLEPMILLQFPVYVAFLSLVFFIPLSGSHTIMKRSKEEMLEQITTEFNQLYFKVYGKGRIGELSKAGKKQLRQLEMLDRLSKSYEIVDRMPVWPFDLTIIRNFLLTILIPFIFVLIEVLF